MKFDDTCRKSVEADLDANKVVMLIGEPGIGKSSFVEGIAKDKRTKCFVLPCNQLADKADLTGARLIPDENGGYKQVFYPHEVIADAITYAKENPDENPILFLDEINRATPDVTSEALSIPTNRAIGSAKLPDNLRVMCAGNDKGNVISLDSASINRFVLYHIEPDLDTFFAVNEDLNQYVKDTLVAHPDCLFCKTIAVVRADADPDDDATIDDDDFDDDDGMQQLTSPRSITAVSAWLNHFDRDDLLAFLAESSTDPDIGSSLEEVIEGHVGHTCFAAFLMETIVKAVSSTGHAATATLKLSKPATFDDLAKAETTSMDDIEDAVNNLRDKDKSGCVLYALYDRCDHRVMLDKLTASCSALEPDDLTTLISLVQHNKLYAPNVDSLLKLDAGSTNVRPFVTTYEVILTM